MLRPMVSAALAGLSLFSWAAPIDDFRNATDFALKPLGASGTAIIVITSQPVEVPAGYWGEVTKASGSLNGTVDIGALATNLGLHGSAVLTGTDLGSNRVKWAVTAPDLIGQTVTFTYDGQTYTVKITSISGTYTAVLASAVARVDPASGRGRNVTITKDPTGTNTFTMKGNLNGNILFPVRVDLTNILYEGLGGQASGNFVSGRLLFSNLSQPPLGLTASVELRDPATGVAAQSETVTLDETGFWWMPVAGSGTYDVWVKELQSLSVKFPSQVMAPALTGLERAAIRGDIDGDNSVTVFDYSALSNNFDVTSAASNWNTAGSDGIRPHDCDIDLDGAITVFDYSILSDAFDRSGEN